MRARKSDVGAAERSDSSMRGERLARASLGGLLTCRQAAKALRRDSHLGFTRGGLLVEVLVDEGDAVTEDQVLARLDTAGLLAARRELDASGFVLPDGYRMEIGGENEQHSEAIGNLMLFALPLLVLMAGTIILSFNSFRFAAVIESVAVLSIGLAMLGVWLFGYPLGFLAVVGTMGLVGLAINGGIVVLAALRANPEAMQSDPEATREVVVGATRHILGTTLTTVGGFVPLILFGGRFWPPMATAIAGGVGGSAILSLYLVPSLFMLIVRRRERVPMTERTEARADATPLAAASNPV